ncbi:MAG: hypothetical protein HUU22_18055, partial [Phycisphaerae bacterium]|nr:hypothetical protein [Phycisphaerae bacterium]
MSLKLYKDALLTDIVSEGGAQSNPDSDTYNGTTGEYRDKQLHLANAHSTLAAGIDASTTAITLADTAASVGLVAGLVIIIDDEQMYVEGHSGT